MANMSSTRFGIEIEVIVEPHTLRTPPNALSYYQKLSASLRKRGQKAQVDDLRGGYRTYPDNFTKWWITKDGSLNNHGSNQIAFEAVSPIFSADRNWDNDIDAFWDAMAAVFHQPIQSPKCGSHIHISPGLAARGRYAFHELKVIAFGVVAYEPLVLLVLPASRHENVYCRPNTKSSSQLGGCHNLRQMRQLIASARSLEGLKDIMQADRRVLWNFENTLLGKSGTIEFRGGRGLRGRNRTKRWIAFAVSFIHFVLNENDFEMRNIYNDEWRPTVELFYEKLRSKAKDVGMRSHLPSSYRVLNETQRERAPVTRPEQTWSLSSLAQALRPNHTVR
ncbi:putative amidoligase enzyme-domain-containing protein [Hypoxylon cercidicola]|nr:putative amidoligase enzyme-domain-containing protein [Hypoxylon cercidicola]